MRFKINIKKLLLGLFVFIICGTSICCTVSYADNEINKVIPRYNSKDTNLQPGLYQVSDMNYARNNHQAVALEDGRVLIIGGESQLVGNRTLDTAEIFDPTTGKFTKLKMNFKHGVVFPRTLKAILLKNGNVLITGGCEEKNSKNYHIYEIFDSKTNNFINGPYSTLGIGSNVHMWNGNDEKIYISLNDGYGNSVIEEYNIATNTISEIITKNNSMYNKGKYKIPRNISEQKFAYITENIGFPFEYSYINDKEAVVAALNKVEYGLKVDDIDNGKYKTYYSWYSPLYLINFEEKTIKKLNEYIHSANPSMTKMKNRNQVLITGGCVPNYIKNPNQIIRNKDRINMETAMKATRHAYILVY